MKKVPYIVIMMAYLTNLACTSVREIPPAEVKGTNERVLGVVYPDGKVVMFKKTPLNEEPAPAQGPESTPRRRAESKTFHSYGKLVPETQSFAGTTIDGVAVSIPAAEVQYVRVRRVNVTKSLLVGAGLFVVTYAGFLLLYYGALDDNPGL